MRLTHEEAIRNVLQNPQLSKAAIRLYLMLALHPSEEIRYLTPDVLLALGCTPRQAKRAVAQLLTPGIITRTGKGKIIMSKRDSNVPQEREILCEV